jgi:hypothetical protein
MILNNVELSFMKNTVCSQYIIYLCILSRHSMFFFFNQSDREYLLKTHSTVIHHLYHCKRVEMWISRSTMRTNVLACSGRSINIFARRLPAAVDSSACVPV